MPQAVCNVVELVRPDRPVFFLLRVLLGQAAGDVDVVVGILVGHGGDFQEFRTAEPDHVLLLLALGIGYDDHRAVAEGVAHEGETNPGITGGALDNHAAGSQLPPLLGISDDGQGGSILDRTPRIQELGLAENFAAGLLGNLVQADQGRIADGFDEAIANIHGG